MPGSSSRRKRRIVTGRRLIARFLLAPNGAYRHRASSDCPVPPRAANGARIVTGRRLTRFLRRKRRSRIVTGRRLIAGSSSRRNGASSPGSSSRRKQRITGRRLISH
ncbi:hypothetical protein [Mycobacterium tuberculosis]|uniref:hypothetical protein n=1 Tax=Mycobacterium tuberculosis TaxID=1773 RepID=UPI0032B33A9A